MINKGKSMIQAAAVATSVRYWGMKINRHQWNCNSCKYGYYCKTVEELVTKRKIALDKKDEPKA